MTKKKEEDKRETITKLVDNCIITNNSIILIELILRLEQNYIDVARLATFGEYDQNWTHEELLKYITHEV